jgi:hypothetical protein
MHGNGKYMWSNGRIYEGDWVEGNMTGTHTWCIWTFLKTILSIF